MKTMEKHETIYNSRKKYENDTQFVEKHENDSWRIQTRGQALKFILSLVTLGAIWINLALT